MKRTIVLLFLTLLLVSSGLVAHAAAPPIVLSVSLSSDRPALGSELLATIVVFADTPQDVAVDAAGQAVTIHCTPVGLAVVRIGAGTIVGARVLRFSAGGQAVERQIYVGILAQPPPHPPHGRWLPLIRR
jgi:hypothetical protein